MTADPIAEIERLEKLVAAATPAPWTCMEKLPKSYDDHGYRTVCETHRKGTNAEVYARKETMADESGVPRWGADGPAIAALRNAGPALLACARELAAVARVITLQMGDHDRAVIAVRMTKILSALAEACKEGT